MTRGAVLIVEDEPAIRATLAMAIEIEGFTVHAAENGKEALELLEKIPRPCLIFLDLMMPVMSGWEFADSIRQNAALATIPIVVITAYSERAKGIQVDQVIKKPVDLDILMRIVHQYCG